MTLLLVDLGTFESECRFFLTVHLAIRGAKVTGHSMFYHVASFAKYLTLHPL